MTKGTLIFVLAFLLMFIRCEGGVQQCRGGFNTTIFNIPIGAWNESYSCPSDTEQSCFLAELKYSTSILNNQDLTINFGSCVPTAYESLLTCDALLAVNGQTLQVIFPILQDQADNIVTKLSEAVAEQLYDRIVELDKVEVVGNIIESMNISVPSNIQNIIRIAQKVVQFMLSNSTDVTVIMEGNDFDLIVNTTTEFLISRNISMTIFDRVFPLVKALISLDNSTDVADILKQAAREYIRTTNLTLSNGTLDLLISIFDAIRSNETGLFQSILLNGTDGFADFANGTFETWEVLERLAEALNESEAEILLYLLDVVAEYFEERNYTIASTLIDFTRFKISYNDGIALEDFVEAMVYYLESMNATIPENVIQYMYGVYKALNTNESDLPSAIVVPILRVYGEVNNVSIPQEIFDDINGILNGNTSDIPTVILKALNMYMEANGIEVPIETISMITNLFDVLDDRNNSFSFYEILNISVKLLQYSNVTIPKEIIDFVVSLNHTSSFSGNVSYINLLNGTLHLIQQFNTTNPILGSITDLGKAWREGEIVLQAFIIKATIKVIEEITNYTIPDPVTEFLIDLADALTHNESDISSMVINNMLERLQWMYPTIPTDVLHALRDVSDVVRGNDTNLFDLLEAVLPVLLRRANVSFSENIFVSVMNVVDAIRSNDSNVLTVFLESAVALLQDVNITVPDKTLEILKNLTSLGKNSSELHFHILDAAIIVLEYTNDTISFPLIEAVINVKESLQNNESNVSNLLTSVLPELLQRMNTTIPENILQSMKNLTLSLLNNSSNMQFHILDALRITLECMNEQNSPIIVEGMVDIIKSFQNNESDILLVILNRTIDVLKSQTNVTIPTYWADFLNDLAFTTIYNESSIRSVFIKHFILAVERRTNLTIPPSLINMTLELINDAGSIQNIPSVLLNKTVPFLQHLNFTGSMNMIEIFANALNNSMDFWNSTDMLESLEDLLDQTNGNLSDYVFELVMELRDNSESDMYPIILNRTTAILQQIEDALPQDILQVVTELRTMFKNNESNIYTVIIKSAPFFLRRLNVSVSDGIFISLINISNSIEANVSDIYIIALDAATSVFEGIDFPTAKMITQSLKSVVIAIRSGANNTFTIVLDEIVNILQVVNGTIPDPVLDFLMNISSALKDDESDAAPVVLESILSVVRQRTNVSVPDTFANLLLNLTYAIKNNDSSIHSIVLHHARSILEEQLNITIPSPIMQVFEVLLDIRNNENNLSNVFINRTVSLLLQYVNMSQSQEFETLFANLSMIITDTGTNSTNFVAVITQYISEINGTTLTNFANFFMYLKPQLNESDFGSIFLDGTCDILQMMNITIDQDIIDSVADLITAIAQNESDIDLILRTGIKLIFTSRNEEISDEIINQLTNMSITIINNQSDIATVVLETGMQLLQDANFNTAITIMESAKRVISAINDNRTNLPSVILEQVTMIFQSMNVSNPSIKTIIDIANALIDDEIDALPIIFEGAVKIIRQNTNITISDSGINVLLNLTDSFSINESCAYCIFLPHFMPVLEEQMNITVPMDIVEMVISLVHDARNNDTKFSNVVVLTAKILRHYFNQSIPMDIQDMILNFAYIYTSNGTNATDLAEQFVEILQQLNGTVPQYVTEIAMYLKNFINDDGSDIASIIVNGTFDIAQGMNTTIPLDIIQIVVESMLAMRSNETDFSPILRKSIELLLSYVNINVSENVVNSLTNGIITALNNDTDLHSIIFASAGTFLQEMNYSTAYRIAKFAQIVVSAIAANESDTGYTVLRELTELLHFANESMQNATMLETLINVCNSMKNNETNPFPVILEGVIQIVNEYTNITISNSVESLLINITSTAMNNESGIFYFILQHSILVFEERTNITIPHSAIEIIPALVTGDEGNDISHILINSSATVLQQYFNMTLSPGFPGAVHNVVDNIVNHNESSTIEIFFDVVSVLLQEMNVTVPGPVLELVVYLKDGIPSGNETDTFSMIVDGIISVLEQTNIMNSRADIEAAVNIFKSFRNNESDANQVLHNVFVVLLSHSNFNISDETINSLINVGMHINDNESDIYVTILEAAAAMLKDMNYTIAEGITRSVVRVLSAFRNNQSDQNFVILDEVSILLQYVNVSVENEPLLEGLTHIINSLKHNESDILTVVLESVFEVVQHQSNITITSSFTDALIRLIAAARSNDSVYPLIVHHSMKLIKESFNITIPPPVANIILEIISNVSTHGNLSYDFMDWGTASALLRITKLVVLENIDIDAWYNYTIIDPDSVGDFIMILKQLNNSISDGLLESLMPNNNISDSGRFNRSMLLHEVMVFLRYMNASVPDSFLDIFIGFADVMKGNESEIFPTILYGGLKIMSSMNKTLPGDFIKVVTEFIEAIENPDTDIVREFCITAFQVFQDRANITMPSPVVNMVCGLVQVVVNNDTGTLEIADNLIAVLGSMNISSELIDAVWEMINFKNETDVYSYLVNVTSQYLQENNTTKLGKALELVQLLTNVMLSNNSENFTSAILQLSEILQDRNKTSLSMVLRLAGQYVFATASSGPGNSSPIWNATINYLDEIGFPVQVIELIQQVSAEFNANGTDRYHEILMNATLWYLEDLNITASKYVVRLLYAILNNETDVEPVLRDIAIKYLQALNFTTGDIVTNLTVFLENIFANNSNPALNVIYNNIIMALSNVNMSVPMDMPIIEILSLVYDMRNRSNAFNVSELTYEDIVLRLVNILQASNVTLPNDIVTVIKVLVNISNGTSQNNSSIADGLLSIVVALIEDKYCVSTDVTRAYAEAVYNDAIEKGAEVDPKYERYLECVPGYFLATYPNDTDVIEDTVILITLYYNNITKFIEVLFSNNNMTVPSEIIRLLHLLEDLDATGGNRTNVLSILSAYLDESTQPTELSQLIITALERNNVSTTGYKILIEYTCLQFYSVLPENATVRAEMVFKFINAISSGIDLGAVILDVLNSSMVDVPDEVVYILLHIQPVIDAAMSNETDFANEVRIFLLNYTEVYPNAYVDLYIEVMRLYSIVIDNNMTLSDPAVKDIVKVIIALSLNIANTSADELFEKLGEQFPTLILLETLKDNEIVAAGVDIIAWYFDSGRNASTLVIIVEDIIRITLERRNITVSDLIANVLIPTSCKYEYCDDNMCNVLELLDNTTAVTASPRSTTAGYSTQAPTLARESTTSPDVSTSPSTSSSTTVTTSPSLTTTSTTTSSGRSNAFGISWLTMSICLVYTQISKRIS